MSKAKYVTKYLSKLSIEVSWPTITFYRLKKNLGPCKKSHHNDHVNVFFNENESNGAKMIIPSNIVNHIAIAISVKIIAKRYFFQIVQL